MTSSCYSDDELAHMGFRSVGKHVRLSRKASLYGVANISIGHHVRVDDFCVLSAGAGGIFIGNYIHIAVFSSIIGGGTVRLEDFVNISSRVSIYSSNDDYSGAYMTNPMVPSDFTNVVTADVKVCKHAILGCGAVVLPGVVIGEGVAVGALSMVKRDCESFGIYSGVPAIRLKERQRNLLKFERELAARLESDSLGE